jgi:CheY-like chemotaxis protein
VATALEERLPLLRGLVPPGINVHCAASADALPVKLDPAMLTQVLSLVILNASEAYPDGNGKVSLAFGEEEIDDVVSKLHAGSRPGRFARISISDYGRGMPAEVLARAANPLLTVRGEFGHIGLDLPSVLAVMSDHDGFMTVESRPERGTTVSLYFPLSTQPIVAEDPHQLSLNNEPPPANTRVMIVEDSPELREMLSEMIKCLGYNPIACDNKESAMELLEAGNVDILVVEESLPGLAAHDLVSQAHAPGSHVKTVLLASGQNSPCEDSDTVLLKPFDISQLAKALDDSEQKTLAQ